MKKLILFISILAMCSCEDKSDDELVPIENTYEISLSANETVAIHDIWDLQVNTSEAVSEIIFSFDAAFEQEFYHYGRSYDQELHFYFNFLTLGNKSIYIKTINSEGVEATNEFHVSVIRGNAVQVTAIQLHSFYRMDETWDPEFSDENRLADVKFIFLFSGGISEIPYENLYNEYGTSLSNFLNFGRYETEVKLNQENLYWDLAQEELYVNPNYEFTCVPIYDDLEYLPEPLLLDNLSDIPIDLAQYSEEQPESIMVTDPYNDFEMELFLEWP